MSNVIGLITETEQLLQQSNNANNYISQYQNNPSQFPINNSSYNNIIIDNNNNFQQPSLTHLYAPNKSNRHGCKQFDTSIYLFYFFLNI